jgi:hypothetical protein
MITTTTMMMRMRMLQMETMRPLLLMVMMLPQLKEMMPTEMMTIKFSREITMMIVPTNWMILGLVELVSCLSRVSTSKFTHSSRESLASLHLIGGMERNIT